MRTDEPSASFLSRWMRRGRPVRAEDWADYGTAFGLELSMEEGVPTAPQTTPAASAPAERRWYAPWLRG
jgi:hypothetical protein